MTAPDPRAELGRLERRREVLGEVTGALDALGDDELEVALLVVHGLARGRQVYGELSVAADARDFRGEAAAEVRDALVYLGAELVRLRRRRPPAGDDGA